MSAQIISVVAAVVDTRQLTLYQENGDTVEIPQGDPRLAKIVEQITPILADGKTARVDLSSENNDQTFRDYEEASGGFVKFFKVAKSALLSLFGSSEPKPAAKTVPTQNLGRIPVHVVGDPVPVATPSLVLNHIFVEKSSISEEQANRDRLIAATKEIISNAVPVGSSEFHERDIDHGDKEGSHTIISVVNDQVISGVEKIKPQIARAVELGSTKAMDAFMTRISKVAKYRRHSVDDLLKFLKRGDLPIADNGNIIIYKVLKRSESGGYVDCHTKKIQQRVGSRVWMDPSLVDHDRGQECSNGLHVASKDYIYGFSGDVCVLAYVNPEDVIAVPMYDPNKMRVCAYHILDELPEDAYSSLRQRKSFSDNSKAKLMLGKAIAGGYPEPDQSVHITKHNGGGVIITPLVRPKEEGKPEPVEMVEDVVVNPAPTPVPVKEAEPIDTTDKDEVKAPAVDPKSVAQKVMAAKAESRVEKAERLWNTFDGISATDTTAKQSAAEELLAYKKATKISWTALGLSNDIGETLQKAIAKSE
jgi:hypothetical protein